MLFSVISGFFFFSDFIWKRCNTILVDKGNSYFSRVWNSYVAQPHVQGPGLAVR